MIRMLIVDDKRGSFERVRNIFELLQMDGKIQKVPEIEYIDDVEKATDRIKTGIFHLVLIDLSLPASTLTATTDYNEFIGLRLIELAHEFNKDTVLVAYTSYATQNLLKLVKLKVDSILNKAEPDDKIGAELLDLIKLTRHRFNFTLDYKLDTLLSKAFSDGKDMEGKLKWQICVQKIVSTAREKVSYMKLSQGYSGAGVVVAFLDSQLPRVFKLHRYEELKREIDNFEKYVRYYIPKAASTRIEDLAQAGDIGILSYSFVGKEEETFTLGDIVKHYERHHDKDVFSAITNYFDINCSRWFARTFGTCEPVELATKYKQYYRLSFEESKNFFLNGNGTNVIDRAAEILSDSKHQIKRSDVFNFIDSRLKAEYRELLCKPVTYCHGDLNVNNLIWEDGKLWMIDFYRTGEGPRMVDFAKLETSLRFDVPVRFPDEVKIKDRINQLLYFEEIILKYTAPNSPELNVDMTSIPTNLRGKISSISAVRQCASKQCGSNCKDEYNLSLFFVTTKYIQYLIEDYNQGKDKYPELVCAIVSSFNLGKEVMHLIDDVPDRFGF